MAVPADMTTLNISGKYVMNKTLSDPYDEVLKLQGVSWLKRNAVGLATVTLNIKHWKEEDGVEKIHIDQSIQGGIEGTKERRTLDWTEREHTDKLFGEVIGKSHRIKVDEVDVEWLKKGWTADTLEHGLIQAVADSDTTKSGTTWNANQTWGFEEVKGERRYVRHLKFTGPSEEDLEKRLVYDYVGPADEKKD